MVKIKKKYAIITVLIAGAILAAWKFVWEPWEHRMEAAIATPPTVELVTPPAQQPAPSTPGSSPDSASSALTTRSVKTSYGTPAGKDPVGFTITTDSAGIITAAKVEVLAENSTSKKRQEAFAAGLPQVVVGKKLSDLTAIDRVGGSSLTTNAFNASLEKLKSGV